MYPARSTEENTLEPDEESSEEITEEEEEEDVGELSEGEDSVSFITLLN